MRLDFFQCRWMLNFFELFERVSWFWINDADNLLKFCILWYDLFNFRYFFLDKNVIVFIEYVVLNWMRRLFLDIWGRVKIFAICRYHQQTMTVCNLWSKLKIALKIEYEHLPCSYVIKELPSVKSFIHWRN